jgi:hypothetical protein
MIHGQKNIKNIKYCGVIWNYEYSNHKSDKNVTCLHPAHVMLVLVFQRLGAVHDGSPPPSYLGGPGAEKCRWEDGYIMSDLRHTDKGFRWSPCSVSSFHHFLKYV